MSIALIVHGGAKTWPPEKHEAAKQGCLNAMSVGWEILETGGSALDAVEASVRVLEDDPTFNAAYGAVLNADGKARLDAGIMDGAKRDSGAIGAIEGVRHPISVARLVLQGEPAMIVGAYARDFAAQHGAELCDPDALITDEQREEWEKEQEAASKRPPEHNTVGAVARDAADNLACGVSTGGTGNNIPGRVGDSATVGGGFYADNRYGACAMTGDGETIMRSALAARTVDLLQAKQAANANTAEQGEQAAQQAAAEAIEKLVEYAEGEGGCILVNSDGNIGWAHNSEHIACAYRTADMTEPRAYMQKSEEPQMKAHSAETEERV